MVIIIDLSGVQVMIKNLFLMLIMSTLRDASR